jgi:hypothetical protein
VVEVTADFGDGSGDAEARDDGLHSVAEGRRSRPPRRQYWDRVRRMRNAASIR